MTLELVPSAYFLNIDFLPNLLLMCLAAFVAPNAFFETSLNLSI